MWKAARIRQRILLGGTLLVLTGSSVAHADVDLIADGQLGAAFLGRSRSHAIGHAFKPAARVGLRAPVTRRLELGASVSGILDASQHYRVVGGLAHARLAVWAGPVFSTGLGAGLGAGYDADILHTDLRSMGGVRPYGFLALDTRWKVADCWLVGLEGAWENLSILRVGFLIGMRWTWKVRSVAEGGS